MSLTILDTGPLVASLNASDQCHARAVETLKRVAFPLVTCEPVIVETCFLLSRHPRALEWIERWLRDGKIRVAFELAPNAETVFALMSKYRDLPMSLADACLVAMADANRDSRVFTFDRHFALYRCPSRRKIKTIGLEE